MNSAHKILLAVSAAVVSAVCGEFRAGAQDTGSRTGERLTVKDSVITVPAPKIDSTLAGKDIFAVLPSKAAGAPADVKVHQSALIRNSLGLHIKNNAGRPIEGYRVRIFFDNRQSARQDSEAMMEQFERMYPGVPAYRSYVNPYFKITVGDFRTKSEAMSFLQSIIGVFPKAFIVKEHIEYPAVDRDSLVRVDTVKILRRLAEPESAVF